MKLTRKPSGDTFEFGGRISVGQKVTEVTSTDNSDLSEAEFNDARMTDDGISASPKDFTEVSPEAIAVKVKLDAAIDLLKSLRGQNVEVLMNSLEVTCGALRAGAPGCSTWSAPSGFRLENGVTGKLNRDKLATALRCAEKSFGCKPVSAKWSDDTGKLTLTFKRPSELIQALGLTDTIKVTALPGPDRPDESDHIMLWVGVPSTSTVDETDGPRLGLADDLSAGDGESISSDDSGAVNALAKQFKAQRRDVDKSAWK